MTRILNLFGEKMTAEDFRNALMTAEGSGKSEFRKLAEYSADEYDKWPVEIRNKIQKPADYGSVAQIA